jgi:hypothetical protein
VTDGEPHELWQLPVDLEWVATVVEADPMRCHGAFLDLLTGEIAMPDSDMADDEGVRNREANQIAGSSCLASVPVRCDRTWPSSRP